MSAQLHGYSLTGIREMLCSYDWNATIQAPWEGWTGKVKRETGQLNAWCHVHCGTYDAPAESFWVRIKLQINIVDIVGGVCYRPPNQDEVDEVFFRQLKEVSYLHET